MDEREAPGDGKGAVDGDDGAPPVSALLEISRCVALGCGVYGIVRLAAARAGIEDTHTPAAKLVCLAHAILSPACGAVNACAIERMPRETYTPLVALSRQVWCETGYYVLDTALESFGAMSKKEADKRFAGTLLHHLVPLAAAWGYSQYRGKKAADPARCHTVDWLTACLFVGNSSTVFHHVLWFLDRGGSDHASPAYRAALAGFFGSFVGARLFGLLYLVKALSRRLTEGSQTPSVPHGWSLMPLRCRISVAVFSALNAYWLYLRARRAMAGR